MLCFPEAAVNSLSTEESEAAGIYQPEGKFPP